MPYRMRYDCDMSNIFDSLLAHLDARSLPQIEELSQAAGVPYHTIAKIKRRETLNPRIETVQKLLAQLDRPIKKRKKAA